MKVENNKLSLKKQGRLYRNIRIIKENTDKEEIKIIFSDVIVEATGYVCLCSQLLKNSGDTGN